MQWIPRSKGGQVRLATLGFGVLLTLTALLQLDRGGNGGVTMLSALAVAVLLGIMIVTGVLRRQISIWEGPATAVLAILVGMGLKDPVGVMGLCIGVVIAQSMYGGPLSEILRVASLLTVVPASVALSETPIIDEVRWDSPATIPMLALVPLFAMLAKLLKGTLERQSEAKDRARFMARFTGDLLAADSVDRPSQVMTAAAADITRLAPGVTLMAVRATSTDPAPEYTIVGLFGEHDGNLPEQLPADLIGDVPNDAWGIHEVKGIGQQAVKFGLPAKRRWYVHIDADPLPTATVNMMFVGVPMCPSDRLIGVQGSRPLETLRMLTALLQQRHLTYEYLRERQGLLESVNRDDVTGLVKRSVFLAQVETLLGDGTQGVELILIGCDGLATLAAESGFSTSTVAVSRLARRLLHLVGDRGPVGRFSDHRFAVAVPVLDSSTEIPLLVEDLRRYLSEPVELEQSSVSFTISIGTARSEAGISSMELVERAALALRSEQGRAVPPLVRTA